MKISHFNTLTHTFTVFISDSFPSSLSMTGSYNVALAVLELEPPTSAFQRAGIKDVSHYNHQSFLPSDFFLNILSLGSLLVWLIIDGPPHCHDGIMQGPLWVSINFSAPPQRMVVHVLALGQPVKKLYLRPGHNGAHMNCCHLAIWAPCQAFPRGRSSCSLRQDCCGITEASKLVESEPRSN